MQIRIAKKVASLGPSPTLALNTRAKLLRSQGAEVLNLSVGEPDFATPLYIQKAAISAIQSGLTHYTPSPGILELREAISEKFKRDNKIAYSPDQIIVGVGAKNILSMIFQVVIENGDEVIVPTPTWSTYVEQVKLAGGKPILVSLDSPYHISAKLLQPFITKRTKAIILNYPSNPTGVSIPKRELAKIAEIAIKHNLLIISDEIYEKVLYEGEHCSIAALGADIQQRTLTVNGFSKAYAMTGWRVGYAAGPTEVIQAMANLADQATSGTSSISQYAALAALSAETSISEMQQKFSRRLEIISAALNGIPGIRWNRPDGAFYLFLDISELLSAKYPTSLVWSEALLKEKGVVLVPGEAFYAQGRVRLSFAASEEKLSMAAQKIREFVLDNN